MDNGTLSSALSTIYQQIVSSTLHSTLPNGESQKSNYHPDVILTDGDYVENMTQLLISESVSSPSSMYPASNITNTAESEAFLNTVGLIRWFYLPVVALGTVTNIMNMIVFSTGPMRRLTTTVYLAALAGGDIINLYAELFRYWVEWMDWLIPPEIYFSDAYCKVANYIGSTSRDFTNWLVALVTIERTIVLAVPFRAKTVCTLRRARLIVVCLLVVILAAHVPLLVVTVAVKNVAWVCWTQDASSAVQIILTIVFYGISNSVIILVFVLNMVLIVLLYRSRRPLAGTDNDTNTRQYATKKLTGMLLSVGILFIVCEMPRLVVLLLYAFSGGQDDLRIALSVAFLLSGINHTANFFIYVLSGRRFRRIFADTFPCVCARRQATGNVRSASLTNLRTYRHTTTAGMNQQTTNVTHSTCTLESNCSKQTRITTVSTECSSPI